MFVAGVIATGALVTILVAAFAGAVLMYYIERHVGHGLEHGH